MDRVKMLVLQDWQYESEGRKKGPEIKKDDLILCTPDFAKKLRLRKIAEDTTKKGKAKVFPPAYAITREALRTPQHRSEIAPNAPEAPKDAEKSEEEADDTVETADAADAAGLLGEENEEPKQDADDIHLHRHVAGK